MDQATHLPHTAAQSKLEREGGREGGWVGGRVLFANKFGQFSWLVLWSIRERIGPFRMHQVDRYSSHKGRKSTRNTCKKKAVVPFPKCSSSFLILFDAFCDKVSSGQRGPLQFVHCGDLLSWAESILGFLSLRTLDLVFKE